MQTQTKYCSAASKPKVNTWMADVTGRLKQLKNGNTAARLAREPMISFAVAGTAIFLAYSVITSQRSEPVRYTPEIAASLENDFEQVSGRRATPAERERFRNDFVTDELFFREAVDKGMYLTDPETRQRLIDRMRYMVAGVPVEPTEQQLIDYYASNTRLYQTEAGTSFNTVFFAEKPVDSASILARLQQGETVSGDDFWLGRDFPEYGDSMVRGMFGQEFLGTLKTRSTGHWYGPVRSSRGWHFVRKTGENPTRKVPYSEARSQVRMDFMLHQTQTKLNAEAEKLKDKYRVEITG